MTNNHVVIMAKRPQAGGVKTRLARQIGSSEAVRVYRTILDRSIRELSGDPRWQLWLAVAPDDAVADNHWPGGLHVTAQGAGDLGQRMQRVFDTMPPGPVLIVGSDIPGITRADMAAGFAALGSADVVFGPAPDGGYWLVGQRRMPKPLRIFDNVRWSTEHALADTSANIDGEPAMLRTIADIDTETDYRAWLKNQR